MLISIVTYTYAYFSQLSVYLYLYLFCTRPLPNELIEYARTDTHYLLHIASRMCRELQDRDLLPVTIERARQLCLKVSCRI